MKDPLYDEWWEAFGQPSEKPVPNEPLDLQIEDELWDQLINEEL